MENPSYRSKSYFSKKGFDKNSPVQETRIRNAASCSKLCKNAWPKPFGGANWPCFDISVQGHKLHNPERQVILNLSLTGSLV